MHAFKGNEQRQFYPEVNKWSPSNIPMAGVGKKWSTSQNQFISCFSMVHGSWAEVWYFLSSFFKKNGWKTFRKMVLETWKFYEIQIQVSLRKVFLEQSHTHLCIYCLCCFHSPIADTGAVTETVWLTKPKTLTIWTFMEIVCQPCPRPVWEDY